jgi:phosphohistidine phosphatase
MKRLYLLRHAKSSWVLAGELDFERGLTDRGITDCALIAELIRERAVSPSCIFCSGARRARETLEAVAAALPRDAKVEYDDAIYEASTEDLLGVLRAAPVDQESILMIGHNPSIHDLSVEIAREGDDLERLAAKFPAAALATFEFDGDWADLGAGTARLADFTSPKQLRADEHETL